MDSVTAAAEKIYLGMDTSIATIVVGVLRPGSEVPVVEAIPNDAESVRRLAGKFPDRRLLAACYEAGPGGYELHRLLVSMGVACDVVAPSLIPRGAGERVKTDRRDAVHLALLHRAGLLTPVRVPSPEEEAIRDLVRTQADLADDRKRMMQRINALLTRHGRVWKTARWTADHRTWLERQSFAEPPLQAALRTYLAALDAREAELAVLERQLRDCWAGVEWLAPAVRRLGCYRGIAELTALTLAAEVTDFRRFGSARAFMGFTGLTPSEYSSGARTRRAGITKADPQLIRSARVGLGLPAPARDRGHAAAPPAGRLPADPRQILEGAAAAACHLHQTDPARQDSHGRGDRGRPRARRVRLGRDDQLNR